ncbi:MAG: Pr6Pr family membrane protein [Candidatus Microbacterium phytovorans]|uniref:Pr6Pr family membrane protein n=1 Tax=Candidatus Microbacterium phytovorans TaxID=3121374 RepID=A0AAJ5VZY9_9MICO|nr:Pr6Pr family membrane protein [Microbacterium sp.]WEK12970.1 MAG: Pr6Pr family membrane protein [Microbacterium sp.]
MTTWSIVRLSMALAITAAILTQLTASVTTTIELGRDMATVVANFFSFFTILSNVIAAVALGWAAAAQLRRPGPSESALGAMSLALACATTYMLITGIVYNVLLRGISLDQGSRPVPWSNEVLHLIGPLFMLVDLLLGISRRHLPRRSIWLIIAFPIVWTIYTLIRGPLVTNPASGDTWWYPYPFLNPHAPGGWPSVMAYVAAISVAFLAVGAFVVWVGNRRVREKDRVDATAEVTSHPDR